MEMVARSLRAPTRICNLLDNRTTPYRWAIGADLIDGGAVCQNELIRTDSTALCLVVLFRLRWQPHGCCNASLAIVGHAPCSLVADNFEVCFTLRAQHGLGSDTHQAPVHLLLGNLCLCR